MVFVAVRDNGPGISSGAMEHLFDPFYSTKESGMGMGLAIARRAIEQHGGELQAINTGEGLRVIANLPAGAE